MSKIVSTDPFPSLSAEKQDSPESESSLTDEDPEVVLEVERQVESMLKERDHLLLLIEETQKEEEDLKRSLEKNVKDRKEKKLENIKMKQMIQSVRSIAQTGQNPFNTECYSEGLNLETYPILTSSQMRSRLSPEEIRLLLEAAPQSVRSTRPQLDLMYIGEWTNDYSELEPRHIEVNSITGTRYLGFWKGDKYHGYGIALLPKGDWYEGYWKEGVPHHKGRKIFASGLVIDADWDNGEAIAGTVRQPSGEVYEGSLKNREPWGEGSLTLKNGNHFSGNFKGQTCDGVGYLYHAEEDVRISGDFVNYEPHG